MKKSEIELYGRLLMNETLLGVTIAHVSQLTDRPDLFCQQIMANTEEMLLRKRTTITGDEARAFDFAMESFSRLSQSILRHILKEGPPSGHA